MNGSSGDMPERLLDGDPTALERRVLENALERGPSRELSLRMARALGVNVTTPAAPPAAAPTPVAAQGTAVKVATAPALTWPWVAAGVLALSVAGVVVGTRTGKTSRPAPPPSLSLPAAPSPSSAPDAPGPAAAPAVEAPSRPRAVALGTELRGEIDLLDGARAAVAAKAGRRALEILGRYGERYPSGNFVPEATAVKIEALMQLGRVDEARALATRFVSEHRDTVLAGRIAALVDLPRP